MPLKVYCDKCYALLYKGRELKTQYEIIAKYDGYCPNCTRKLSPPNEASIKL